MAVDGYTPLPLLPCIGNDEIEESFKSLNALKDAARQGFFDVSCDPIEASLSGSGQSTTQEACTTVELPQKDVLSAKCIYLLTTTFSYSGAANIADATADYVIKCGEKVIGMGSSPPDVVFPIVVAPDCEINDPLEICLTVRHTQTSTDVPFSLSWNYEVCGSRLCINDFDRSPECWVPCVFDGNCCYGMEAVALIVETLNALCDSYSVGGDSVRIVNVEDWNIDTTSVVALNLSSDATFIAFGHITVCYNNFQAGDEYLLQPTVGCPGNTVECLTAAIKAATEGNEFSAVRNSCKTIPVIACGDCSAGESIFIGANSELVCDTEVDNDQSPQNVTVTGDWCVWIYEEVDVDIDPLQQISECLDSEFAEEVIEKADAIHAAACNRGVVGCYTKQESLTGSFTDDDTIIQPATAWEPPVNDPSQLPPEKKWFITGAVRICVQASSFPLEDTNIWALGYEIKCGGTVVYTSPTQCPWILSQSGNLYECSPWISIAANVQCDITQPISICIVDQSLFQETPGSNVGNFSVEGSISMVCL